VLAAMLATGATGAVRGTPVSITDPVWSGYAASGATFTEVKGTWVQPVADCGSLHQGTKTTSAFWIGLDGFDSNTVE
jgi:Peptidase A4 family